MKRRRRGMLSVLGFVALALYASLALYGCVAADKLIFQPQPASYGAELPGLRTIAAPDGVQLAVLHLPNPTARHTIFYFHGNAEDLGDVAPILRRLQSAGFGVLAFDYRGYGRSSGRPSEESINTDTRTVLAYAAAQLGVSSQNCVLVGRSVGSGPAVALAAHAPVAGLVLVSPFTSAFRVVTHVKLIPFDRFDNLTAIREVHCPVLIFHGTADQVIPFAHGEKLFAAASEPKRHVWIEHAGHNDIFQIAGPEIVHEISSFAQTLPAPSQR
jgi:fermentation-respiration switch protein FrsA (DUF1100 family)